MGATRAFPSRRTTLRICRQPDGSCRIRPPVRPASSLTSHFSGGVDKIPSSEAGYDENQKVSNTYSAPDDLQWQLGKHSFTFGGQVVEVQFNYIKNLTNSSPLNYTFSASQTGALPTTPRMVARHEP